jgi:hypothetical protein
MKTELITETGAVLDLLNDIPISLNFSIAEVQDPSKRNGSHSKTIELPGSAKNNAFFEHWFEVNIETLSFNINRKTPVRLYSGGVEVFKGKGNLRLREIETKLRNNTNEIKYKAEIYGELNDLWFAIGDAKLENLTSLAAYNHVYNRVNQVASWSAPIGTGYVYPLIDYGYNGFLTNHFKVEQLRPAFYEKTLFEAIMAAAGKTATFPFGNTTFFKKQYIPHNGDKFSMAVSSLATYEFYVGDTGLSSPNSKNLQSTGSSFNDWWTGDMFNSMSSAYDMIFNDDSTNPFVDTGNRYNTSTGVITIGQTGSYSFNFKSDFEIKLSAVPAGTATINHSVNGKWALGCKILRSTDGGATWSILHNDTPNFQTALISTSYQTFAKTWTFTGSFDTGDQIRLLIHPLYSASGYGLVFKDGSNNPITTGTATIQWRYRSSATCKVSLTTGDYVSGQTIDILDAVPKDVKQKDFLLSLFRKYHLYVTQDPNDENNYIIETRDEFYNNGETKDWTQKLAYDMPFVSKPANSATNALQFIYKYKEDQDYYNKKYLDANAEVYGTHKEIIGTDFAKTDLKTELIFSATPVVDNPNNSMIIPKIFSYDGTNVKPTKHNIRTLMFNGVQTLTGGTWTYEAPTADALGAALLTMNTYPASAMVDDPLNPTESIEFGVPNEVFYTTSNYTNNNLYNRFYYRFVNELTDRDSRIVTAYFYLTASDINRFDFRDTIFVKDAYYIVNQIIEYNPLGDGLTKVELLLLKDHDPAVTTSGSIATIETNLGNASISARMYGNRPEETNVGNANNVLIGDNNSSRSVASFISGSRNSVGPSCYKVSLISTESSNVNDSCYGVNMIGCSGNNVGSNCSGITLINCNNTVIDDMVYDFTGINLNGEQITTAQSGTARVGVLTTFESTGTSL